MSLPTTGRLAGAFFLLAFVCYGVGSALGDSPAGTTLVMINSLLVAAIGVLAFRALRGRQPGAAWIYLVARCAEAYLLAAGVILLGAVGTAAADLTYQLAMVALGLGSMPLCLALRRQRWLPGWLALWGCAGYALLAAGAVAELMGVTVGILPAVPGGLFEVVLGVLLLARGFTPSATVAGPQADTAEGPPPDGVQSRIRRAALASGLGLALMAVLAGVATFGVVERLAGADATAAVRSHQDAFALAIAALLAVACLDVLVAWALRAFFEGTHPGGALLSAWTRTVYAVVYAVAITRLIAAFGLAQDGRPSAEVAAQLTAFGDIWSLGLILFGVHLLLVGWLAWRSPLMPTWVGVLVAVAGAGYVVDSAGALVSDAYTAEIAMVTFVGEIVLLVWLLMFAARRSSRPATRPAVTPHRSQRAEQVGAP
ncbi:MAG: DUF4386 domain-containing protein [Hamadaea sp.]|nr:DUF4386 domain-containing protein [Hamadaea sp.]